MDGKGLGILALLMLIISCITAFFCMLASLDYSNKRSEGLCQSYDSSYNCIITGGGVYEENGVCYAYWTVSLKGFVWYAYGNTYDNYTDCAIEEELYNAPVSFACYAYEENDNIYVSFTDLAHPDCGKWMNLLVLFMILSILSSLIALSFITIIYDYYRDIKTMKAEEKEKEKEKKTIDLEKVSLNTNV